MKASDVKRLKELEDENRRLKHGYAETTQRYCYRKAVKPAVRRELVDYLKDSHGVSQQRACRVVGVSDSVYRYKPDPHRDDAVIAKLQESVERYPAYGFSKLFKVLRRCGHPWNQKRVYRLYCELKLNKRRPGKKRLASRSPEPLAVPAMANPCCGPEFISTALAEWTEDHSIDLDFIQPSKPTQNSYVERFNRTYRDEVLNMHVQPWPKASFNEPVVLITRAATTISSCITVLMRRRLAF